MENLKSINLPIVVERKSIWIKIKLNGRKYKKILQLIYLNIIPPL